MLYRLCQNSGIEHKLCSVCAEDHQNSGIEYNLLGNPLFREFLEALCRYNLIPTYCLPHKNDVLFKLLPGNLRCFSLFEQGTTLCQIMVRPLIALQPPAPARRRALRFCLCSTTSGAAAKPLWRAGAHKIPAPLVRPTCNCQDSPSGLCGPCSFWPAQVGYRNP